MRKLVVMIFTMLMLAGCSKQGQPVKLPNEPIRNFVVTNKVTKPNDKQLTGFLQKRFVKKDGVITTTGTPTGNGAHGKEYLSESTGLWLSHLATTRQFTAFRQFYTASKKRLYNGTTFNYRYDPAHPRRSWVNATGDDLRIMEALLMYDEATESNHYRYELSQLFGNLAPVALPNGQLRDFYDTHSRKAAHTGSLAYFNLQTLHYLEDGTKAGRAHYRRQLQVVRQGYLGDALPLYAKNYDWTSGKYSAETLNMSEALIVLLNLTRVGHLKAASAQWLRGCVDHKMLPNRITTSGQIVNHGQADGSWAIAAEIFATLDDKTYYNKCMRYLNKRQVKQGPLQGGFGDARSGISYSFDNLTVLRAYDARGLLQ